MFLKTYLTAGGVQAEREPKQKVPVIRGAARVVGRPVPETPLF